MSRFWSKTVHQLEPYVPGEQPKLDNLVKLNTNENPWPPSPGVLQAMQDVLADDAAVLRLYPDPASAELVNAIAGYHDVPANHVFVGNGSDEVLAHIFMAFFQQSLPLLFPDITYSFYKVYCGLYQVDYQLVPLAEDFSLCLEEYNRPNGGIIFPNPNAPTGRLLPLADIQALLQRNQDSLVVVDEAYVDFGGQSAVKLVRDFDNLLVVQTFSKSRSLAGLRIGYAIGHSALIEGLERVKNSFNSYPLDRLAIVAGKASLEDDDYFQSVCRDLVENRNLLVDALEQRDFTVLPSAANFVFARHSTWSGEEVAARLRQQGVIVRHFSSPERVQPWVRITVGTQAQIERLLAVMDQQ